MWFLKKNIDTYWYTVIPTEDIRTLEIHKLLVLYKRYSYPLSHSFPANLCITPVSNWTNSRNDPNSHFSANLYKASQADWRTCSSGESNMRTTVCGFLLTSSRGSNCLNNQHNSQYSHYSYNLSQERSC